MMYLYSKYKCHAEFIGMETLLNDMEICNVYYLLFYLEMWNTYTLNDSMTHLQSNVK